MSGVAQKNHWKLVKYSLNSFICSFKLVYQEFCKAKEECTAINWKYSGHHGSACILRGCPLPVIPPAEPFQNWRAFYLVDPRISTTTTKTSSSTPTTTTVATTITTTSTTSTTSTTTATTTTVPTTTTSNFEEGYNFHISINCAFCSWAKGLAFESIFYLQCSQISLNVTMYFVQNG